MGKPKYEPPTNVFPYKIPKRLNMMSVPRRYIYETEEGMPTYTPRGIRISALNGHPSDRINDIAWPYLRRLLQTKRICKNRFSQDRLERMDRMIEAANATVYSKLANCVIDLKTRGDNKDTKKKRGWTETEWKKHMDYIGMIAGPKKVFKPSTIKRGHNKPLDALMPRIRGLAYLPDYKVYRRLSQEEWYRNPEKVSPNALKYVPTDRTKKLAEARVVHLE